MEKLSLIVFFTIAAMNTCPTIAIAQTTQSKHTQIIINKKGEILDTGGNKLGYIDKDNIARNLNGKKVYYIDRNGNVIDATGRNLGKANKNGTYYNLGGENVLTVRDKDTEMCEILDPVGHKMGEVHKNYKLHACAAHCFFLQQKQNKQRMPKLVE